MRFRVRKLPVGPLQANCYLVWSVDSGGSTGGAAADGSAPAPGTPCLVIDPGAEPERILAALQEERLRPELVVATHCHGDHIGAADEVLAAFPKAQWAVGAAEAEWPARPALNLSYGFGMPLEVRPPTRLLRDGEDIVVGPLTFRVLAVPGHSPGSLALYCAAGSSVFTGDALFAGDIGRADLPGGDERQLVESVRTKLLTLPDETVVWPGHANRSRVGFEKRNNPYVGES